VPMRWLLQLGVATAAAGGLLWYLRRRERRFRSASEVQLADELDAWLASIGLEECQGRRKCACELLELGLRCPEEVQTAFGSGGFRVEQLSGLASPALQLQLRDALEEQLSGDEPDAPQEGHEGNDDQETEECDSHLVAACECAEDDRLLRLQFAIIMLRELPKLILRPLVRQLWTRKYPQLPWADSPRCGDAMFFGVEEGRDWKLVFQGTFHTGASELLEISVQDEHREWILEGSRVQLQILHGAAHLGTRQDALVLRTARCRRADGEMATNVTLQILQQSSTPEEKDASYAAGAQQMLLYARDPEVGQAHGRTMRLKKIRASVQSGQVEQWSVCTLFLVLLRSQHCLLHACKEGALLLRSMERLQGLRSLGCDKEEYGCMSKSEFRAALQAVREVAKRSASVLEKQDEQLDVVNTMSRMIGRVLLEVTEDDLDTAVERKLVHDLEVWQNSASVREELQMGFHDLRTEIRTDGGDAGAAVVLQLRQIFNDTIAGHREDFVGREWLCEAIDDWAQRDRCERVLLIAGERGVGKSAMLAQVIGSSHCDILAYYFCDARLHPKSLELRSFLNYVILSLCGNENLQFKDAFLKATGVDSTKQALEALEARQVQSVVTHFQVYVLDILTQIQSFAHDTSRHYLVLDSMDDGEGAAEGQQISASIVGLLRQALRDPQHPWPEWLYIIAACREPQEISKLLLGADQSDASNTSDTSSTSSTSSTSDTSDTSNTSFLIHIDPGNPKHEQDLRAFATKRLGRLRNAYVADDTWMEMGALDGIKLVLANNLSTILKILLTKARGNFQYARHVLDDLENNKITSMAGLQALPASS